MPEEISIEKVLDVLELSMEALFNLSQAKTPESQATELAEVKALVMTRRRELVQKYANLGAGPGARQVFLNNQAAQIIQGLELPKIGGRLII